MSTSDAGLRGGADELARLLDEARADIDGGLTALGLGPRQFEVVWNARLRTTRGRACWCDGEARVELNPHLYLEGSRADRRQNALHELCHVVAGREAGHGPVWKGLMRQLGLAPERCHSQATPLKRRRRRFVVACDRCGTETQFGPVRVRRMQVGHYEHRGCGGRFRRR